MASYSQQGRQAPNDECESPVTDCWSTLSSCFEQKSEPNVLRKQKSGAVVAHLDAPRVYSQQPLNIPSMQAGRSSTWAGYDSRRARASPQQPQRSQSYTPVHELRKPKKLVRISQISGPSDFRHLHSQSIGGTIITREPTIPVLRAPSIPLIREPPTITVTNYSPSSQPTNNICTPIPVRPTVRKPSLPIIVEPPRPPRPVSFRRLEMDVNLPETMPVSPLLPYFDAPADGVIQALPVARLAASENDDNRATLTPPPPGYGKGYSPMSFHIPRRQVSNATCPPISASTKARVESQNRSSSSSAPDTNRIIERIASAMIEVEKLQSKIEQVAKRQNSVREPRRQGSCAMPKPIIMEFEPPHSSSPIPVSIPIEVGSPAYATTTTTTITARSFTDRVTTNINSARAAPPRTVYITSVGSMSRSAPSTPHKIVVEESVLTPPLPLNLRKPMRSKKSMSMMTDYGEVTVSSPRVMGHDRMDSDDSIIASFNASRALDSQQEFYQCIAPTTAPRKAINSIVSANNEEQGRHSQRSSFGSLTSLSTLSDEEDAESMPYYSPRDMRPIESPVMGEHAGNYSMVRMQPVSPRVGLAM